MSSPAFELAHYLVEQGVAAAFGGGERNSAHVSREPASPAEVITLYDTGGPDVGAAPDIRLVVSTLQVRVRALEYLDGYELQRAIHDALEKPGAVLAGEPVAFDAGAHRYIVCALRGDIISLGRDSNERFLFTANYELQRQPLETST